MPTGDREQQFERALSRLLRDACPESHCPDAETLSAYHERSLPEAQMARWKEHISECVRCQEILTLVEQSEDVHADEWEKQEEPVEVYDEEVPAFMGAPAQPAPQPELRAAAAAQTVTPMPMPETRSRPRWRWLIPIGAVAAGAIVAVGVHEIRTQHGKEAIATVQMARNQRPASQPSLSLPLTAPAPAKPQGEKEPTQPQALDSAVLDQKQAPISSPKPLPPQTGAVPSSNAAGAPPADELASAPRRETLANPAARMVAPVAPEVADRVTAEKDRNNEALTAPPPAPAPAAGVAKKSAPEVKEQAAPTSAAQAVEIQRDSTRATLSRSGGVVNDLTASLLEVSADHRYIVAPGMKSVWRVGDAGKIERSTDRGETWLEQSSGVTADLTAGSATSDQVCWVIGKTGTILLSTDGGKHWKRVASPIPGVIGGIHATDALHASIWDVPNHMNFETNDGGATWNRVANE